jgi:hypothetical protein
VTGEQRTKEQRTKEQKNKGTKEQRNKEPVARWANKEQRTGGPLGAQRTKNRWPAGRTKEQKNKGGRTNCESKAEGHAKNRVQSL